MDQCGEIRLFRCGMCICPYRLLRPKDCHGSMLGAALLSCVFFCMRGAAADHAFMCP